MPAKGTTSYLERSRKEKVSLCSTTAVPSATAVRRSQAAASLGTATSRSAATVPCLAFRRRQASCTSLPSQGLMAPV